MRSNSGAAHFSDLFCRWAIDTLARGRDPKFGPFPKNVYVFDFFHKLAGSDGIYQISFDGSHVASGQYFCRLQAKGFVTTRKITLVK